MFAITLSRHNTSSWEGTWNVMVKNLADDLLAEGEVEIRVEVDSGHDQPSITGMWTNYRLPGSVEYPAAHLVVATSYGLLLINVDDILSLSF